MIPKTVEYYYKDMKDTLVFELKKSLTRFFLWFFIPYKYLGGYMSEEVKAFLFGASSILNVWGNQTRTSRKNPYKRDAKNIRRDFCMVGHDFKEVIRNGRKECL